MFVTEEDRVFYTRVVLESLSGEMDHERTTGGGQLCLKAEVIGCPGLLPVLNGSYD